MKQSIQSLIAGVAFSLSLGVATIALADPPTFKLSNPGSYTISKLFVGGQSQSGWGADLLGGATIAGGRAVIVTVADGSTDCVYDVYMRYAEGFDTIQEGINICKDNVVVDTANDISADYAASKRGTP